jgi:hypothetical protein
MKRINATCVFALVILLLSGSSAQASLIPWAYDWNAGPAIVPAGGGWITLSNEIPNIAVGNSHVVATNLKVFSTDNPNSPDTFSLSGGHYGLTVNLADAATHHTGSLTFTGQLQGSFSEFSANVTNVFFSPTTQSIQLGNTMFTVTVDAYTPPGPAHQGNLGSIGAYIQVAPAIHVTSVPEPGSITLAGLGFCLAGVVAWRRRKPVLG